MWRGEVNLLSKIQLPSTALHQGLSKYLAAKDTHNTQTPTKHKKTQTILGNLLSFQSRSNFHFFLSLNQTEHQSGFCHLIILRFHHHGSSLALTMLIKEHDGVTPDAQLQLRLKF